MMKASIKVREIIENKHTQLNFLVGTEATHYCLYFILLQITKGRQAVVATDGDDIDALLDRLADDGEY